MAIKEPAYKVDNFENVNKIKEKIQFVPDKRKSRIIALEALYQLEFRPDEKEDILKLEWIDNKISDYIISYSKVLVNGVYRNSEEIEKIIKKYSKNYDKINSIDKIILRFSIYQLFFDTSINEKVIIDEAVEISKSFSSGRSYKFINGVLDKISKDIKSSNLEFEDFVEKNC